VSRNAVPVPRGEAAELVSLTRSIDAALVHILARLEKHDIAQDIVMDLSEIASASLYVRHQMERALERGAEPAKVDAEAEVKS